MNRIMLNGPLLDTTFQGLLEIIAQTPHPVHNTQQWIELYGQALWLVLTSGHGNTMKSILN